MAASGQSGHLGLTASIRPKADSSINEIINNT